MQISVFAIGRMKNGPEQALAQHYFARFAKIAPLVGLSLGKVTEITESKAQTVELRQSQEGNRLADISPPPMRVVLLDEKGKDLSSHQLADWLGCQRDEGGQPILFALGGPDGHSDQIRERAMLKLSFGRVTWPHQLARILLAEQLYRAATILAGHPYHRG